MLAIGRLGCFANGCCRGLPTDSPLGVSFPFNPLVPVWPSQLFESAASFLTGAALIVIERFRAGRRASPDRAVAFPVFLIAYGTYRFIFDFMREGRRTFGLQTGQYFGLVAASAGICWLAASVARGRRAAA
jgi:phosphatidylglycerol:prolipoprotein diacylglycerol transferase